MVYQVVNPANQDQTDIAASLLLDFKSHNDIISTKDYVVHTVQEQLNAM
jgi:hypothetical protein